MKIQKQGFKTELNRGRHIIKTDKTMDILLVGMITERRSMKHVTIIVKGRVMRLCGIETERKVIMPI